MWIFDFLFADSNSIKNINDLEENNLWRPQNPNIEINPKHSIYSEQAWKYKPQAYECNWNWYYNFAWAKAESEYLGKKIPTKQDWESITKWLTLKELSCKLPLNGMLFERNNVIDHNTILLEKEDAHYWSASSNGNDKAYQMSFYTKSVWWIDIFSSSRSGKFSVRCLKN